MPYIEEKDRKKFYNELCKGVGEENIAEAIGGICNNAGDLNYVFTCIAQAYLAQKGLRYQNINDIIGALEGCKLELYRRLAAPYEDIKIKENGDVNLLDVPIEKVAQLGEG